MPCNNCDCPFQVIRAAKDPSAAAEFACMLEDVVHAVTFEKGDVLFMQGQPSTAMYAINDGAVKICTYSPDGWEQIVDITGPRHRLVGLQSINDERYAYSAIAATRIVGCRISHRTVLQRAAEQGELAMRLIRAVNVHLAHSRSLLEVLGHRGAATKIASFILLMSPRFENGDSAWELPVSRTEMASLLGLSEETVCRFMASFKRHGAIRASRSKMEIVDWDRLQAIADGSEKWHYAA
jgi:CRP/FNR family transcriptional regulator